MTKSICLLRALLLSSLPSICGAAVIVVPPPKEDLIVAGAANAFVVLGVDAFYTKNGVNIGLCEKPFLREARNCKTFEQLAFENGMTLVIPAFNMKENKIFLYGRKNNTE